jgi:hypothetical protein
MTISDNNKFITIFEDIFFNNFTKSEKLVLTSRENIINIIANTAGLLGFTFAYVLMVMRSSTINIPIFRDVVVIDIKAGLILSNPAIAAERRDLNLNRWHLPSIRMLIEVVAAYLSYKRRVKLRGVDSSGQASKTNRASCDTKKLHYVNRYVPDSRRYLFYLVSFYIHKSIMLNNSKKILSNAKSVVCINEFTPQVLGYLSALYDIKIPLTLYLPTRIVEAQMPNNSSLNMFSRILAKNGIDADFINTRYKLHVNLEKTIKHSIEFDSNKPPRVGVFLASYYTMETKNLSEYIKKLIIPLLNKIQRKWNAKSMTVSCHPSDLRSISIFHGNNVAALNISRAKKADRMLSYDLVICGNSSVAEEALSNGIPVVYMGCLDAYEYDLFKYVADGIVIDATKFIPPLNEVKNFYKNSSSKSMRYINGVGEYEFMDLIDAIVK